MGSTFWPIIVLPTDAGLSAIAIEDLSPRYRWIYRYQGVYGEFIGLGFLVFVSYIQSIPTKCSMWEKVVQIALLFDCFGVGLALGWTASVS